MEELSIEEKAKGYDDALERAKSAIKECGNNVGRIKMIESIFPELKESEDEKIRKHLISLVKNWDKDGIVSKYTSNANDIKQILAWLEKQDEHSIYNVPSREVILAIWDLGNEWKELTNGSISTEYGTQLDYIQKHWHESEYYLREKQGEQKPANKAVPKFKVGDWITDGDLHCKITDVLDDRYIVDTKFAKRSAILFKCENNYHLWTIQDAKDGDVLYSLDTNQPFIYKARNIHEQATAYCGINKYGKFFVWNTNDCIITLDKYIPATKEQRELLFRKMKEAGYVWNPTTKELSHKEVTKKSDKVWNEEDEEMKDLIDEISCHNDDVDYETHVRITRWLNELKQRLS